MNAYPCDMVPRKPPTALNSALYFERAQAITSSQNVLTPYPFFVVESELMSSSVPVHVGKSGFWCSFTSCERHGMRSLHRDLVSGPE